jgi:N-acetylglutamate synthase-like GNAT family acetyltransferase
MVIRDATADDWPAIWRFMRDIAAAGETFSWDRDITEEDARAYWLRGPPARAVGLWRSLGFEVVGTVPEGFHHPVHGYVGLHVMHRRL